MPQIKKRVLASLLALALVLSLAPEALAAAATATTAQLAQKEGTVTVSNSAVRKISIIDKMRLYNGYRIKTDEKSYAWINLDDAKLGKLDAVSEVELRKNGKKLEVLLNEGNIFFNITEPLKDDESLNIRTSSMSIGIRGTSGWAEVTDERTAEIYTLEGTVEVTVTDAVTGSTTTDSVSGGGKLVCQVSDSADEPTVDSDTYTADDVNGFVLMALKDDEDLREKVTEVSGMDSVNWSVDPERRLKADQDEVHRRLEEIRAQERRQANNVSEYALAPSTPYLGAYDYVTWSYDEATRTLRITPTGTGLPTGTWGAQMQADLRTFDPVLETIIIEDGIPGIPHNAFSTYAPFAHYVTSVSIPNSVTYIAAGVFSHFSSLQSITIPGSVTTIYGPLFSYCSKLTDIYFEGTQAQLHAADYSGWDTLAMYNDHEITVHCTDGDIIFPARSSRTSNAAPTSGYSDVPSDAWYAEAVAYCRKNNLMSGTSDTKFSPDEPLTRAMIVTVLHRLAGSPAASGKTSLSDVQSGKWYTEAISWANSEGIVQGYPNGSFGVNDPVTHGQVALIFQRYSGDSNLRTIGAETPKASATRAEIAATLMDYSEGQIESLAAGELSDYSAMDEMCAPGGIAADDDGSLIVTDLYNKQVWSVTNRSSANQAGGTTVKDLYGQPVGGYNDAGTNASYFKAPWGVAPYQDGWAVADAENNAIRLVQQNSVKTLPVSQKLDHPTGLASDGDGNLYISDTFSGNIYKYTSAGDFSTVASNLTEPTGLCWKDGVLYIAETGANRIVKLENGKVSTVAGSGNADLTNGSAARAAFDSPQGIAVADDGTIYVADTCNSAIRQIKNGTVSTLYVRDISQTEADLVSPAGLLLQGNRLLICDSFSRKIFSIWLK